MRRLTAVLLSALLAFSLTACGSKPIDGLDQLRNDQGLFAYPGLSWGMTTEQVEEATGWALPQLQQLYNEDGDFVDAFASLPDLPFGGENWTFQLQFTPEGGLWSVTLAQNGEAAQLKKVFETYRDALVKEYGDSSQSYTDQVIELASGSLLESSAVWETTNEDGQRINVLALSYRYMDQKDSGSLAMAMNYRPETS